MTSGLRIRKPNRKQRSNKHSNTHEITFPSNTSQSDGGNEDIEEECDVCRAINDSETAGTELEGPYFCGVGDEEGCEGDVVAAKKMKRKGITTVPTDFTPFFANVAERAIM